MNKKTFVNTRAKHCIVKASALVEFDHFKIFLGDEEIKANPTSKGY